MPEILTGLEAALAAVIHRVLTGIVVEQPDDDFDLGFFGIRSDQQVRFEQLAQARHGRMLAQAVAHKGMRCGDPLTLDQALINDIDDVEVGVVPKQPQQQRIAIVRALCMNPQVMLFDEVTAALDPEMVQEVLEVIRDLAGSGMTLLIVTHELAFAQAVADRIVFMDGGHILEQAAPHQFFDNPRSQRARQFLAKFSYTTVSKRKESA